MVDAVTLEVVRHACIAIAEEMNATLVRTGYSPNIKERRDCSCAVFDADAELVSQAENMPVHLGAMPFSVRAAIDRFPPASLEPGDAILLNDPFRGGAHLPDLTLVTPVFEHEAVDAESDGGTDADSGDLLGFVANRAHHADVGGSRAGSVAADSTEIYQEGIRIPPVKLFERGEPNPAVHDVLLSNVRTPDERRGDLRAQAAANRTGVRRFRELADRYGTNALSSVLDEVKDYSERRMRAELDELPDGTYEFADVLDDDGRGTTDIPIRAAVTVDGTDVTVDFAGTAAQVEGPVNAVFAVTASATYYAVRCVTDPDVPPNHGCYRPIRIEAPEGSIVNPNPPAAVVGGNLETSQRVTDVVLGALGELVPERVTAAGQGTMNNVTFGGVDPHGSPYAFYETQGGGFGGRRGGDGMDGVHVHMSNTRNTPVEVLETAYPLRVERYAFREDSGGAGEFRGGLGLRRDIRVRNHVAHFSVLADRHRHAPYGFLGGESGEPGAAFLVDPDGVSERLPQKSTHDLEPGTVVSIRTPGAGGYGDPVDRDPEAVARDVRLGKVSASRAREKYGTDWEAVDEMATD